MCTDPLRLAASVLSALTDSLSVTLRQMGETITALRAATAPLQAQIIDGGNGRRPSAAHF